MYWPTFVLYLTSLWDCHRKSCKWNDLLVETKILISVRVANADTATLVSVYMHGWCKTICLANNTWKFYDSYYEQLLRRFYVKVSSYMSSSQSHVLLKQGSLICYEAKIFIWKTFMRRNETKQGQQTTDCKNVKWQLVKPDYDKKKWQGDIFHKTSIYFFKIPL